MKTQPGAATDWERQPEESRTRETASVYSAARTKLLAIKLVRRCWGVDLDKNKGAVKAQQKTDLYF